MQSPMTKHLIASFSRRVPSRSCTKPSSTRANCSADHYQHIDSPIPHSSGRTPASPLRTILLLQFPTLGMGVSVRNFQLWPKGSIHSYWKTPPCKTASAHRGRIQHQRWSLPLISAIPGATQAELKARIPRCLQNLALCENWVQQGLGITRASDGSIATHLVGNFCTWC